MNSGAGANIRGEYCNLSRDLWEDVVRALQSRDEDERWRALTRFVVAAPAHWTQDLVVALDEVYAE